MVFIDFFKHCCWSLAQQFFIEAVDDEAESQWTNEMWKFQTNHSDKVSTRSITLALKCIIISLLYLMTTLLILPFFFLPFCSLCKLSFELIVQHLPFGYFSFQLFFIFSHLWVNKKLSFCLLRTFLQSTTWNLIWTKERHNGGENDEVSSSAYLVVNDMLKRFRIEAPRMMELMDLTRCRRFFWASNWEKLKNETFREKT